MATQACLKFYVEYTCVLWLEKITELEVKPVKPATPGAVRSDLETTRVDAHLRHTNISGWLIRNDDPA